MRRNRSGETLLREGIGDVVREDVQCGDFEDSVALLQVSLEGETSTDAESTTKEDPSVPSGRVVEIVSLKTCVRCKLSGETVCDALRSEVR